VAINPKKITLALVSPRQRAHQTFEHLFANTEQPPHIITEDVREWDYGRTIEGWTMVKTDLSVT
jgi:probable phosphoglycerate mutase